MQLQTLHERRQVASGMESRRVNPVVVLEQLPESVVRSSIIHARAMTHFEWWITLDQFTVKNKNTKQGSL